MEMPKELQEVINNLEKGLNELYKDVPEIYKDLLHDLILYGYIQEDTEKKAKEYIEICYETNRKNKESL